MKTLIGQVIGNRYEIVDKLGGGGMALVYKGIDRLLSRTVTVKVLREQLASDPEVVRRFQKEAQAVAKLSHPNIVSIYDVGQGQDLYYLVMEYIEGQNLKEVIQEKGRLGFAEAIEYALQICDALQHAHDNNIIHRDIKPHNILITNLGRVKVTDFGIAQAATSATMTYSGSAIIGTVQYISPEQARGEIATVHTDIYSAGIVLYEMITGQLPFEGDTAIGIAMKHIHGNHQPPSEIVSDVPLELERIIAKGMAKNPQDRYNSATEMKEALGGIRENLLGQIGDTQVLPRIIKEETIEKEPAQSKKQRKPKLATWLLLVFTIVMLPLLFYFGFQKYVAVGEVSVPDVINLPLAEAERILLAKGLQWELGKSRYDAEIPTNYILAQTPKEGEKIKKTRAVLLDLSLGPKLAKVPDVIGKMEREAQVEIANAGFKLAEELLKEHNDNIAEGYISRQEPGPNQKSPMGSEVQLIVSLGSQPRYIAMPNLIGKSLAEAKAILEGNKLEIGDVTNEVNYDYFSGQVVNQDIAAQDQILQKTVVNLALSLGPGPTPKMATVEVRVQDDGEKHQIRVVIIDQTGEHEEYDTIHDPGDFISIEVPYFGKGRAEIYEDDQLIHETSLQ